MATITKKKIANQATFGGVPYGNLTVLSFPLVTNAVGAFVDSDVATGIGLGDKVRIGILPAGFKLIDSLTVVSDAFTALVTANIGIEAVDGTTTQDDADYFNAALTLHTVGRYRAANTAVAPITLAKDHYLILTTAGAANAAVGVAEVLVEGVLTGAP